MKLFIFTMLLFVSIIGFGQDTKIKIINKIRYQYTTFATYQNVGKEHFLLKKEGKDYEMTSSFRMWVTPQKILSVIEQMYIIRNFETSADSLVFFGTKKDKIFIKTGKIERGNDLSFEEDIINGVVRYEPLLTLMFNTKHRGNHFFRDSAIDSLRLSDTIYQAEPCYKFNIQYDVNELASNKLTEKEKKMLKKSREILEKEGIYDVSFEESAYLELKKKMAGRKIFNVNYYFRKKDFQLIYYVQTVFIPSDNTFSKKTITFNPQLNHPLDEKVFEKYSK